MRTMCWTCAFSAPPVPTTASFTDLGLYSWTCTSTLEPGAQHGAPGLTELQGGVGIAGEDELLHRHLVGPVLLHHRGDAVEDRPQPLRPALAANPDTAAGHADAARAVGVDHPEPRGAGARVDAQDAVAELRLGLIRFGMICDESVNPPESPTLTRSEELIAVARRCRQTSQASSAAMISSEMSALW